MAATLETDPPLATVLRDGSRSFTGRQTFDAGATIQPGATDVVKLIVAGAVGQAADLQRWQDSAGAVLSRMTFAGGFATGNRVTVGNASTQLWALLSVSTVQASNVGAVIRGVAAQSANLQEWQDSTPTAKAFITSGGLVGTSGFRDLAFTGPYLTLDGSAFAVTARTAAQVPFIVQGAAAQSANLQEWRNDLGAVMAALGPSGRLGLGGSGPTASAQLFVPSNGAAGIGVVVKGAAAQAGSLQEWQDSGGAVLANVTASGRIFTPRMVVNGATSGVAQLLVVPDAVGTIGAVIRAIAGQTAALQEWQDSTPTTVASVDAAGRFRGLSLGSVTPGKASIQTNLTSGSASGAIGVDTNGAANVGLLIVARAGQTGDLQQWQDSATAILHAITPAGLPKWAAASTVQTTVGAAGGASALPATPTKFLKVVDNAGTTLVVPAYAAA